MATATKKAALSSAAIPNDEKYVVLMFSSKGGVGKSWISACAVQMLRHLGVSVKAIDADGDNESLAEYAGVRDETGSLVSDPTGEKGVLSTNIALDDRRGDIVREMSNTDAKVVWIDLPGSSKAELQKILDGGAEGGIERLMSSLTRRRNVVIGLPITSDTETNKSAAMLINMLHEAGFFGHEKVKVCAFLNGRFGKEDRNFAVYFGRKLKRTGTMRGGKVRELLLSNGAVESLIPPFDDGLKQVIALESVSLFDAPTSPYCDDLERDLAENYVTDLRKAFGNSMTEDRRLLETVRATIQDPFERKSEERSIRETIRNDGFFSLLGVKF